MKVYLAPPFNTDGDGVTFSNVWMIKFELETENLI